MDLKEFSTRLGLSPTTVSRALGGYPEVNADTRERVLKAADHYNYRPNQRARALATGRSMTLGHVLTKTVRNELMNPIFGDFIAGVTETSALSGYSLSLTVTESGEEEATYRKLKSDGSVDGIVIQSPLVNDTRIALMRKIGLPFVVHGRASEEKNPYAWVDVNNKRAFERATRFLLDLGHRRIGLINGPETMDFAVRRRQGYSDALVSADVFCDPALIVEGSMTEENGYVATRQMLAQKNPPSAFAVASIILAIGARRAIEEAGLVMGRDVSLVAYDDDLSYLSNRQDIPLFTAVRSSVREAGHSVARMLISQITTPDTLLDGEMLEVELVVGRSTGPAPSGS